MESAMKSKPKVCFEFQVEKILNMSSDGNYQVQWAPAWVSKFHLVGCEHLIQEFVQQQAESEFVIKSELEETSLEGQCATREVQGYLSEKNLTLAQPASIDQSSVQYLTIKIEEAEEMNNLDTDVFTSSVSHSIPTDSAITTLIDTSTSTNMIMDYNCADSNISSLSTGDMVTHLNQYQESVSEREIKQDHEETIACSQVNTNAREGQVESLPVRNDIPNATDIVGESVLMNKAACTGVNFHHKQHCDPNIQQEFTESMCQDQHSISSRDMRQGVAPCLSALEQEEQLATAVEIEDQTALNLREGSLAAADKRSAGIDRSETRVEFPSTSAGEVDEFHNVSSSTNISNPHHLKEHIKPNSNKKQCPYCTKKFNRHDLLAAHICIHTGDKPFNCDVCGKAFTRQSVLRRHQLTHTGDKPYLCPHCTYSSYQKCNLVTHMQKHTGEKHYFCTVCGTSQTDIRSLKRHERTHSN